MRSFNDRDKRSWNLDVNGDTIGRVKADTGVLLTNLFEKATANELVEDPIKILLVLWSMCRPQAEERKISETQFRSSFGGDAMDEATDALIAEVIDFFPKARRPMALKMVEKGKQIQELAAKRATDTLDKMTPEQLLEKSLGESSGFSPASSASNPAG